MLIARINGDAVGEIADYRELFPHTSFTDAGPDLAWLKEMSCLPVNLWKAYDAATEKLASCAPYIEGDWVYTIEVAPLTPEEIAAREESEKAKVKSTAIGLMTATDWVEFPSVSDPANTPHLSNKAEFDAYRLALRVIAVNPTVAPVWPDKPDEVWV